MAARASVIVGSPPSKSVQPRPPIEQTVVISFMNKGTNESDLSVFEKSEFSGQETLL
jgi:hypothetical protein